MKTELSILARTFKRAGVNRPDEAREKLRWDCVGALMKARVVKLSAKVARVKEDVPCLAYPFEGTAPVLVDVRSARRLPAAALLSSQ